MAGITCGALTSGLIGYDCANQIVGGLDPNVVLINLSDIDQTLTERTGDILTSLVLKTGKKGYMANLLQNTVNAPVNFVKGTYINSWDHTLSLRITNKGPLIKDFINQLSLSRIVAIVRNNYIKHNPTAPEIKGETVFEVYGFAAGMVLLEGATDQTGQELKGGYSLTLGSDENSKEPQLPLTLFDTDLATTEAIIASLIIPAT